MTVDFKAGASDRATSGEGDASHERLLSPMTKQRGRRGGKTNTERSRKYRLETKKTGGMMLSIPIGKEATEALEVIRSQRRLTQAAAVERALISMAGATESVDWPNHPEESPPSA